MKAGDWNIGKIIFGSVLFTLFSCSESPDGMKLHDQLYGLRTERIFYDFSTRIDSRYDSTRNYHDAAVEHANSGNYSKALQVYEQGFRSATPQIQFDPSHLLAVPAVEYIVSEASKYQIVIINEAHHVSLHRFFTMLLLDGLFRQGFGFFGAETLDRTDTSLNRRKYPTLNSGFYSAEPQYGNLVREALRLGYFVFAYEANGKDGGPREMEQAHNIQRILEANPAAKILIHCGYGHADEGEVLEWGRAMAGYLKEFTGIDPLTIDQVELTEHAHPENENPYYRYMNYDGFRVLLANSAVIPLNFRVSGGPSDIFVYHPRSRNLHGRPDWLFSFNKPVFINDLITIDFPVLARAYLSGEDSLAVPVDCVEIAEKNDSTALALQSGKNYRIVLVNMRKVRQEFNIKR